MPDFFLDRFISLNLDVKTLSEMLEEVVKRKGGCIDGINQREMRGGNAVNTASALTSLGVKTTPIVCTNRLGSKLLKFYLEPHKVDLSHTKIFGKASITTAIEFETGQGKTNVMLRDVGSLADFGPHNLNERDFQVIRNADYVCIFNWSGTKRFGTELAETVFRSVKGEGKTYYDTADPTTSKDKIPELMNRVLKSDHVDILSVNENEAIFYASQFTTEQREATKLLSFEDLAKESARILASHLTSRIDLHADKISATFTKNGETLIPTFKVPVRRVTGAGDAWNAGNIFGNAHSLPDEVRLTLANAVAAYYISNPEGEHATIEDLRGFCRKLSEKKIC